MKFLVVVVVVSAVLHQASPNSMDWDEDSGGYPNVDSDFEEESSGEENLKLDRHTSAPIIYHAPSRVVYAHHASQANPLEDTSDEDCDIGEHAPGPPTYLTPAAYVSNILESKQNEVSNEEFKGPQFISAPGTFDVDTSSLGYIPLPVIYSPPLPFPSAYMDPKPIPVASRGYFSESPVSIINKFMNNPPSSPSSPSFVYKKPPPSAAVYNVYNHPTPAPVMFSGPNSNAALYSKPSSAQVVYKYALPSPLVNKEEESFPPSEQTIDYEDDNKPEPIIYDSSVYSASIARKSTFAPYKYSEQITPSNAFVDSFSSQPFYNLNSLNHISSGFAKSKESESFLNLYAEPKQYSIEPSPISSLEIDSVSKIYKNPVPIPNVYIDSEDNSQIYRNLKDSSEFDDIEYEDVDHSILDAIPVTYNEPKSQSSNNNIKDIQEKTKSIISNISYQTNFKSKSSEETVSKLPEVKVETTTIPPKVMIPQTIVKNSIKNLNINNDTTDQVSRMAKIPNKIVKQIKSTSLNTNRLSRYSSSISQQRSPPNYSYRMSVLRASLREQQRQRQRQRYRARSSEEKASNVYNFRNRLRYTTRGNQGKFMKRRPLSRMYHHLLSENKSSEERIYIRRGTPWGRRRQSRHGQSSEEDDESKKTRTRVFSRLNTSRLSERTTTIKPITTTEKNKRLSSRGRGRYENRNKDRRPARQSLQCFLMSLIRDNYRC